MITKNNVYSIIQLIRSGNSMLGSGFETDEYNILDIKDSLEIRENLTVIETAVAKVMQDLYEYPSLLYQDIAFLERPTKKGNYNSFDVFNLDIYEVLELKGNKKELTRVNDIDCIKENEYYVQQNNILVNEKVKVLQIKYISSNIYADINEETKQLVRSSTYTDNNSLIMLDKELMFNAFCAIFGEKTALDNIQQYIQNYQQRILHLVDAKELNTKKLRMF